MSKEILCTLYTDREHITDIPYDFFEIVEVYEDDSHFMRQLRKCKECGQLYLYEMTESIDWVAGNDAQYRTYFPVCSAEEAEKLNQQNYMEILQNFPRLQIDYPSDAKKPKIFWNMGERSE